MWCNFTLTDAAMHEGGPYSEIAAASVRDSDGRIGAILAALERAGVFDDCAFALVADHGMEQNDPSCRGDWDVALRAAGVEARDEAYGFLYFGVPARSIAPVSTEEGIDHAQDRSRLLVVAAMVLARAAAAARTPSAGGGRARQPRQREHDRHGGESAATTISPQLAAQYAKAKIKITYTTRSDGSSFDRDDRAGRQRQVGVSRATATRSTPTARRTVSCDGTGTTGEVHRASAAVGGRPRPASPASLTTTFAAHRQRADAVSAAATQSSETIAGRDASCVTYKASDVVGKLTGLALFKDSSENAVRLRPERHRDDLHRQGHRRSS